MVRNVSNKFDLPDNPEYLDFPRSDGDSSRWPPHEQTVRVVGEDGHVDYMQYTPIDAGVCVRWRFVAGQAVARYLGLPEGKNYVLRDWPAGYRMYDHHKGPEHGPRHDMYLFGGRRGPFSFVQTAHRRAGSTSRYRSINEFIPHAHWLMSDPTMNTANCICKYCQRTPQRLITQTMTQANVLPARGSGGMYAGKPKVARLRNMPQKPAAATRLHVSVQRPLKPLRPSSGVDRTPMNQDRNHDLRVLHASAHRRFKRWFRDGEIVWGALRTPIAGEGPPISTWPCIVEDCNLHTSTRPRTAEDPPGPVPWISEQSVRYRLRCLAVSHILFVNEDGVLPYLAHGADGVMDWARTQPRDRFKFDEDTLYSVNPSPAPDAADAPPPDYIDAVSAYIFAVQIAGEHSYFWTPTDEWEFRYHAPAHRSGSGSRDKSKERGASAPGSLQAALNAAAANNERVERETSRAPSQDAAGVEPDMPADELDEVRTRILGDERPGKAHTQVRYQGLWWGPERIWVDDLVRLKVPRQALAPHGAPHIYAPAPPSAHVVEIARARNVPLPPEQMGAIARSVFMRLSALVVVEYERGGKRTKECRAVGELYELADEGYEEPEPALRAQEKVPESGSQQPPQAATSQAGPSQAGPSQANPPNADPPSNATAKPAPGDVLSGPLWNDRFPLPPPPAAYRWRRITHPGFEAVVSLPVLSGRYYPGILQHPLLRDEMERVMSEMDAASPLLELEGLTSAFSCALEPFKFKQVREQQLVAADQVAREVLASYGEEEEEEEEGNAMEVDEVGDVEMGDAGP
ncbi:uncharacterized protein SCHCODRAFT_02573048 [Schizophyllum commune H4-8]|uniref:uncharacterized protein n=1 Tax=Schizophyllum commune (strain H4-8 / FGSC 9210) TaxID=578458 RepID=UPI00215F168A|nr:uncharacterized protein SCHCODRAFT_02573048 [Schizophyllum commune H4-8]KAI5895446.1 hypothetical protein SCHCODRAFT_02573048 [Schizophyllum commune H4-8]